MVLKDISAEKARERAWDQRKWKMIVKRRAWRDSEELPRPWLSNCATDGWERE